MLLLFFVFFLNYRITNFETEIGVGSNVARLGTIKLVERSPFVGLGLGFCDAARVLFREAWMKKKNDEDCQCPHYGTKPGHFETSKIHFPTSE